MDSYIYGGAPYIVGAIIYTKKWPEKYYPNTFDIIGNSHNIFHLCTVISAFNHWRSAIRIYHERQLYSCV